MAACATRPAGLALADVRAGDRARSSSPRAHTRGADAIILDLEDSVPEAEKDRAGAR